ncbi:MAG: hypothetical protein WDZ84_05345 [Rhodovibrionaceae bacterium]
MLQKLLTVVLPFLLPFLIFWIYLQLRRRDARKAGKQDSSGWGTAPWGAILLAGVLLAAAALVTYRFTVETRWEEKTPPRVTGHPERQPADGGILRPETRPDDAAE